MPQPSEMTLTGRELVVKDLSFIQSGYWLDLVELRLIALAIIVLRKDRDRAEFDPNVPVTLHANLYANMFKTSKSNAYKVLDDAAKSLRDRRIKWVDLYEDKESKGRKKLAKRLNDLSWTTQCSYIEDMAMVQIWFSPQIIPFLIHIDTHFAGYEIRNLVKLTTPYELRLYELGVAWKKKGYAVFNKDTLRERLGIFDPEKFKTASNFNRMLTKAVKTINTETDLTLNFSPIYESNMSSKGRVVKGYEMKVRVKSTIEMADCNLPDPNFNHEAVPGEEGFNESPETPEQAEQQKAAEDDTFLAGLGSDQDKLRFGQPDAAAEDKPKAKSAPAFKPRRSPAAHSNGKFLAQPDENGNWDIDFIVANYTKPLFQIVGMDPENIPESILRAIPEFQRYEPRVGEKAALTIVNSILEKKIGRTYQPGLFDSSDAMAEDGRKAGKHGIKSLTDTEINIVMHNTSFRSRYSPQGQSDRVTIEAYLRGKLKGDLSKIPELKDYLGLA